MTFPISRPRRLRQTAAFRRMVQETRLSVDQLILPFFVKHGTGDREEIASMPGVSRFTIDQLVKEAAEVFQLGIPAIIRRKENLFPLMDKIVIASIGPITRQALETFGVPVHVTAEERSIQGLVDALVDYFKQGGTP